MFLKKPKSNETPRNPALRLLRLSAWAILGGIWAFIIFLMVNHWAVEVPATRNLYEAGLEQGFDSLAGIVAAIDPSWQKVRGVTGRPIGSRLNRLQGDTMFNVWLDQDEVPGWNSGLASLRFDKQGRLEWVRRYYLPENPTVAANPHSGETFPVIRPRLDLREQGGEQ